MGKSSSVAELVGKIDKYSNAIPKANRATVSSAAQAGKAIMLAGAQSSGLRVGGSLPRKNRAGNPGPKWGVRYTLKGDREPSALLAYKGPVHWIDQGTDAHPIRPRTRGRNRRRALKVGAYGFAASVNHPGTHARPFWQDTKKRVIAGTVKTAESTHSRALMQAFR